MSVCYIGIGSNLGDRHRFIRSAIEKINLLKDTKVTKESSIIETDPVGGAAQPKYLNAAIEIQTKISARELLHSLHDIESDLGRVRSVKNAPRTIDLDILLFNNKKIEERDLIVPHPRILERGFVLGPLREIAPQVVEGLLHENNWKN